MTKPTDVNKLTVILQPTRQPIEELVVEQTATPDKQKVNNAVAIPLNAAKKDATIKLESVKGVNQAEAQLANKAATEARPAKAPMEIEMQEFSKETTEDGEEERVIHYGLTSGLKMPESHEPRKAEFNLFDDFMLEDAAKREEASAKKEESSKKEESDSFEYEEIPDAGKIRKQLSAQADASAAREILQRNPSQDKQEANYGTTNDEWVNPNAKKQGRLVADPQNLAAATVEDFYKEDIAEIADMVREQPLVLSEEHLALPGTQADVVSSNTDIALRNEDQAPQAAAKKTVTQEYIEGFKAFIKDFKKVDFALAGQWYSTWKKEGRPIVACLAWILGAIIGIALAVLRFGAAFGLVFIGLFVVGIDQFCQLLERREAKKKAQKIAAEQLQQKKLDQIAKQKEAAVQQKIAAANLEIIKVAYDKEIDKDKAFKACEARLNLIVADARASGNFYKNLVPMFAAAERELHKDLERVPDEKRKALKDAFAETFYGRMAFEYLYDCLTNKERPTLESFLEGRTEKNRRALVATLKVREPILFRNATLGDVNEEIEAKKRMDALEAQIKAVDPKDEKRLKPLLQALATERSAKKEREDQAAVRLKQHDAFQAQLAKVVAGMDQADLIHSLEPQALPPFFKTVIGDRTMDVASVKDDLAFRTMLALDGKITSLPSFVGTTSDSTKKILSTPQKLNLAAMDAAPTSASKVAKGVMDAVGLNSLFQIPLLFMMNGQAKDDQLALGSFSNGSDSFASSSASAAPASEKTKATLQGLSAAPVDIRFVSGKAPALKFAHVPKIEFPADFGVQKKTSKKKPVAAPAALARKPSALRDPNTHKHKSVSIDLGKNQEFAAQTSFLKDSVVLEPKPLAGVHVVNFTQAGRRAPSKDSVWFQPILAN